MAQIKTKLQKNTARLRKLGWKPVKRGKRFIINKKGRIIGYGI